jgi:osmotically inducible lipoprotein OsmB
VLCIFFTNPAPKGTVILEKLPYAEKMGALIKHTTCFLFLTVILSACGHDPGERALTGGGIGAGVGAVGGALIGGNPVAGALIGGAAGAATGALTRPDEINLGR